MGMVRRRHAVTSQAAPCPPSRSLFIRFFIQPLELAVPGHSVAWTRVTARNLLSISRVLGAVDYVVVAATELARVFASGVVGTVTAVAVLDRNLELEVS